MPKLTKRIVDGLRPDPAGETFTWDTDLKGFGVRVMPSGVASFILKYRTGDGRQRKLALGRVGTLTPDQARMAALQHLAGVSQGEDPSAERHRMRRSITVGEVCDRYLEDAATRVKASTLASNRTQLECHVRPLIGSRSVLSITSEDVARLQADIIAGKTAKPRQGRGGVTTGGRAAARRTLAVFGAVLEFARKGKVVKENVARDVERPPEGKQLRFLTTVEIGKLGKAMREAEAEGETRAGIGAVRFLLLSGCRRREALGLRMIDIDKEANCIRLPDTKSGYQVRAMGQEALAALDEAAYRNGYAFPSSKGKKHFVGLPKVLARLCERAKLEGVTIHVLRHSFATVAVTMGFSELTIAGLLGHHVSGVTARYAHVPDSTLVMAADKVAERIADLLGDKPRIEKVAA